MRVREAAVMERRRMEKWRSGEAHRSTRSWSCDCMHMRDVDGWNPVSESCIACRVVCPQSQRYFVSRFRKRVLHMERDKSAVAWGSAKREF